MRETGFHTNTYFPPYAYCINKHFWTQTETNKAALIVLTLLAWITFCGHLHIISWKQPCDPCDLSFPPVRVVLVQYGDQLTFLEAHLVLIGCFVVVHCNNLTHYRGKRRKTERRMDGWSRKGQRIKTTVTQPHTKAWMKECVLWVCLCVLHGWGAGVILPLLASSNRTLEDWNQPFLRFLPRAYKHKHLCHFISVISNSGDLHCFYSYNNIFIT